MKSKRKGGPPPLKDAAKRPRGAGLITRREFRHGKNLSTHTARAYRTGFNTMWKCAGAYMARKGIKKSGQYDKNNVHNGRLYGSRKECPITDKIAGNIIERCYESRKIGVDQLKQVRHSLSYAYYLRTGRQGENFPEVNAQWKDFDLKTLPAVKKFKKPKKIPTPNNLKVAFTKQWNSEHADSLASFTVGCIAAWDTHVFGLRPNVDIKKVKDSVVHDISANEGYGWTEMVDGRSKLHLQKAGTRPWRVFRVCCCKEGKHSSPPDDLALGEDGNPVEPPTWNTVCPVACMELLKICQGEPFQVYKKWFKKGFGQNIGDVPTRANQWLRSQGIRETFHRNSGRKTLGRWLSHLKVPYKESVHIHADLEKIWRGHYESDLRKSGLKDRNQSSESDVATAGLRRFTKWLHQDGLPPPSLRQQLRHILENLDD